MYAGDAAMKYLKEGKEITQIVAGAALSAMGLVSFLLPNHFIDGGVTGVSMLLSKVSGIPLAFLVAIVNAPFLFLGYKHIGKAFTIKSAIAILLLSLFLFIPFPEATEHDKLLGAVFGGFFLGAGVGLAIRGGGVLDGTEILAVILSKRTSATVGEWILGLNIAIFAIAAISMGVDMALYSVLTYFAAFRTIDYLLHGVEAYNGVMIFSSENGAIRDAILNELGRGVTAMKGIGGYSASEREFLYCVVTRLELPRIQSLVMEKDPSAFIVVSPVHEVIGGYVKRRAFH
jgi:uncharacterized membrane-anchored protein YitT (DUF2179 family)